MTAIDRRVRTSPADAATNARITARALDQEASVCTGAYAVMLRRAADRKRAEAEQIDRYQAARVAR